MAGQVVIGCIVGLLIVWVALAILLVVLRPPGQSLAELARVFPNTLRLTVALYRDPSLPRSVRWRLRVAVIYNLQPFNLIPDFIPVIGLADNAIVLIWALRSTIRIAGVEAVARHWPGSSEGLEVVYRAMRLS
jgi:uncharacterized membrane protein YkvA (DUF1232 family)